MYTQEIIAAHPDVRGIVINALIVVINEHCRICAEVCHRFEVAGRQAARSMEAVSR